MLNRAALVLLLGLSLASSASAQAGPGLFGDRHWRRPVAAVENLPATASWGTVHLVAGALYWWNGTAWQLVGGSGGATGPQGAQGIQGPPGPAGSAGVAATIAAGSTTTGAPGSSASVTNAGTSSAAIFNFTIPAGVAGAAGAQGPAGDDGAAGATGAQGPQGAQGATGTAGADGIPRTVQDEGVDLAQRLKINFMGTPITCTDNAGNASTDCTVTGVTVDGLGALTLPAGTEDAPSLRFGGMAAGSGLWGKDTYELGFAIAGLNYFTLNYNGIRSRGGAFFRYAPNGEATFTASNNDLSSGLGTHAAYDMGMYAQGFSVHRWLYVAGTTARSLTVGQAADTPQSVSCADSGDGSPGALTINPTTGLVEVTGLDPHGCAVTMGESDVANGVRVRMAVVATAGGTFNFSDTAGISELAGAFSAGLYDVLDLLYISDRWIETGRSDN